MNEIEVIVKTYRGIAKLLNDQADLLSKIDEAKEEKSEISVAKIKAKAEKPKEEVKEKPIENGFDLGFDDESPKETEAPKVSKSDVIKGFQEFAKTKGKEKAFKILTKFKVKSVHDLKEDVYGKVLTELGI